MYLPGITGVDGDKERRKKKEVEQSILCSLLFPIPFRSTPSVACDTTCVYNDIKSTCACWCTGVYGKGRTTGVCVLPELIFEIWVP